MTKRHDIAIQHSSKRSDWRTPQTLFNALNDEFTFVLDAAASEADHLVAQWMGPGGEDPDALVVAWSLVLDEVARAGGGHGAIFMNPPYSRGDSQADPPIPAAPIEPWIEKAFTSSRDGGCTVVGVLPFSPQTEWYRAWVYGHSADPRLYRPDGRWRGHAAMEVRQLPHLVTFIDPATGEPAANAPGNTCIVIWKPNPGYVGPWQPTVRYWSYR